MYNVHSAAYNIVYEENQNFISLTHEIDNIIIFHDISKLEIIYNFEKTQIKKIKQLILTDAINSSFIKKININNKLILKKNDNFLHNLQLLDDKFFNENENIITLIFDKNKKNLPNVIKEYIWFVSLIRYEINDDCEFDNENKNNYLFNEIKTKRNNCLTSEKLQKLINKVFHK